MRIHIQYNFHIHIECVLYQYKLEDLYVKVFITFLPFVIPTGNTKKPYLSNKKESLFLHSYVDLSQLDSVKFFP